MKWARRAGWVVAALALVSAASVPSNPFVRWESSRSSRVTTKTASASAVRRWPIAKMTTNIVEDHWGSSETTITGKLAFIAPPRFASLLVSVIWDRRLVLSA